MIALAVVFAVVTNQGDPGLVGTWGLSGQPFVTFQADGTGTLDGDPFRWKAKGGTLTLRADGETERAAYQLAADQLVLNLGGMPLSLERLGRAPKAATPAAASVPGRGQAPEPKQPETG